MNRKPEEELKQNENEKYARKVKSFGRKVKITVAVLIIATISGSLLMGTFDVVESGHVKIAVEPSGNIVGPIDPGWHVGWCNPFSQKYDFIIIVQTINITGMHADTVDGHVNIDLTVNFQLKKENVISLFSEYGTQYEQAIISVITSTFRDAFSNNTMRAVALENRSYIQQICEQNINIGLENYHVDLLSLRVQNIALPTAYSDAQIQTQIAYELLRAANVTQQIEIHQKKILAFF